MILARLEIDFRAPVTSASREIGVRPVRLGTKSFDLEYELRGEAVVAEAKTVLVAYDYDEARAVEIPERMERSDWRA